MSVLDVLERYGVRAEHEGLSELLFGCFDEDIREAVAKLEPESATRILALAGERLGRIFEPDRAAELFHGYQALLDLTLGTPIDEWKLKWVPPCHVEQEQEAEAVAP